MSADWRWPLALLLSGLYLAMCAHIWRRTALRLCAVQAETAALAGGTESGEPVLVAYASQTGHAETIARETARVLHAKGQTVHLCPLAAVDAARIAQAGKALFIASTCGEGDAPDNAAAFQDNCMAAPMALGGLRYGLLALGDRRYARYCGFGRDLQAWLQNCGAAHLFDPIHMDEGDASALSLWQQELDRLTGPGDGMAWQQPTWQSWTLARRVHMNPGSTGGALFHLEFTPPADKGVHWESGDLAQLRIPADPDRPRDYSIASIAGDGRVHLLVRETLRPDGSTGAASGWLCRQLPVGGAAQLSLRAHGNFRLQGNEGRPLILVGNGSGLAGLRAHLRALSAAGAGGHWLVYGERQATHDFHHRDELLRWQESGVLARLDLAFSRDEGRRVYVQDLLAEQAQRLREWIGLRDAAIYVCGSARGMAAGVDASLRAVLGDECTNGLQRAGRYRRDVY